MDINSKIAFFLDFSIQEIPSIVPILNQTGGIIYTNSELSYNCLRNYYPSIVTIFYNSIEKIKIDMKEKGIKVIIYPDYHIRYFNDLPGVKHVQVFHGLSDKTYDYNKKILEYDLFFIPGLEAYERYQKKGLLKKGTGVMIGYPKMDRVFRGEISKEKILEELKLNNKNKTVLYAPTWVDKAFNSSWKKFHKIFLSNIPDEINLLVKLHPNLYRYRKNEVEKFKNKLVWRENTRIFDLLPDIIPLMAASDLLIGDVSSVTREYLTFKRPFVFLSNRPKWMWKKQKKTLWECGEVVTKPERLWPAVKRALNKPEQYRKQIEKHFDVTFYKPDGNASFRAAEIIRGLIRSN